MSLENMWMIGTIRWLFPTKEKVSRKTTYNTFSVRNGHGHLRPQDEDINGAENLKGSTQTGSWDERGLVFVHCIVYLSLVAVLRCGGNS